MRIRRPNVSVVPVIYLSSWFVMVWLMFGWGVRGDIFLLFSDSHSNQQQSARKNYPRPFQENVHPLESETPRTQPSPQAHVALPAQAQTSVQSQTQARPQPPAQAQSSVLSQTPAAQQSEHLPQAQAHVNPNHILTMPVSEKKNVRPRSGRREISNPFFHTSSASFTLGYDLGVAAPNGCKILWQQSPSAWMIDIPGRWRLTDQAYTTIKHPLISKVQVLLNSSRARFMIFYRNPKHPRRSQPEVHFTDNGIRITIVD